MAESHDPLEAVPGNTTLWKYLNFRKFVAILETQSLYFPRPSEFDDPFEGRVPTALLNKLPTRKMKNDFVDMLLTTQSAVAVDCWHSNEYESEAMWKIYSGEKGIAIKTKASALRNSLGNSDSFQLRSVQYIDYNNPNVFENFDVYFPYQCKRKSFEHEREVRVITSEVGEGNIGVYCNVDIETLLEEVFVAPDSEDWFLELVGLVISRYGLGRNVRRSSLSETPAV